MEVVCTAGHVDHGKSTLVRALTGMEPDRFEEERRRGLTIDLGFAWTDLPVPDRPARTVAFVDLPGHERFVANMLAGAGAVEAALFVVAADEGWMPQSQEHLEILDVLGVERGVVALTKADLVDAETLAFADELVRESLVGTSFADVDVVGVSARTGMGLDDLRHALLRALAGAPAAGAGDRPRLWVDRSFTIRGAGTVVTGTLRDGPLRAGDELAVLPSGHVGRVRGLQSLQLPIEEAAAGDRVAVNLSGVDRADVRRGHALVRGGQWITTDRLDVWLRPLPGREIGRKGAWHLHVGSAERLVDVGPLLDDPIRDAAGGYARLTLSEPLPLQVGDRFVLREAGRRATIGGGIVLDPDAPAVRRGRAGRAQQAAALERRNKAVLAGDREALLGLHVAERTAAAAAQSAAAVGLTQAAAQEAAAHLGLVPVGPAWADAGTFAGWSSTARDTLAGYHARHTVDRAAPKDVVTRALLLAGCPPDLVTEALGALVAAEVMAVEGPGLRLPDHRVELDPRQQQARDGLLALLAREPFSPPNLGDAAERAGASPALVRELEATGAVVRLEPNLAVTSAAVEAAHARLAEAFAAEGPLTAARAKEALGTSRKFALPLLAELDRRGLTRRLGDVREVRDASGEDTPAPE